ncbi:MAG: hypothetical protein AAF628_18050 [Planctomycetota bacterium]
MRVAPNRLVQGTAGSAGSVTLDVPIPAWPGLVGRVVAWQGVSGTVPGTLGPHFPRGHEWQVLGPAASGASKTVVLSLDRSLAVLSWRVVDPHRAPIADEKFVLRLRSMAPDREEQSVTFESDARGRAQVVLDGRWIGRPVQSVQIRRFSGGGSDATDLTESWACASHLDLGDLVIADRVGR